VDRDKTGLRVVNTNTLTTVYVSPPDSYLIVDGEPVGVSDLTDDDPLRALAKKGMIE
jgi:hypothetical protein